MKIGILTIGQTDPDIINRILENLNLTLTEHTFTCLARVLPIPKEASDEERQQHLSHIVLAHIHALAEKTQSVDRVLGIVDVDIYVPPLSFVFGEAENPGKVALISLWRLRPEFYKRKPDIELLVERATKEAIHELGHTLGLKHCNNPFCIMYFSNSIFETDRKESLFCNKCYLKLEKTKDRKDENLEQTR